MKWTEAFHQTREKAIEKAKVAAQKEIEKKEAALVAKEEPKPKKASTSKAKKVAAK